MSTETPTPPLKADDAVRRAEPRPDAGSAGTVLLVANYAPDVGFAWWLMENFWVRVAELARTPGLRAVLAYPSAGEVPDSIRMAGIPTLVLPFPGRGPRGLLEALRLVRTLRIRCIYFTDRRFTAVEYALYRLAGVRIIVNHDHVPGDRPPSRGLRGLLKAFWRRLPLVNCDLQICVSPLTRERALYSARIPPTRLAVVQNGIEPVVCADDRGYARRELGLPPSSLVCITVGRAHPNKRVDFIIEVARRCVADPGLDDLYFVHCGDGPELARLRQLAARSGVGDRFVFAGRRSDVTALLCSADVALHAAKGEAFSLAVLEYMSAGLPVLVPDVPSVAQAIDDGRTGLIYPDGEAAEAARLLSTVCADPRLRSRLGAAAAAEVRERYSLETMNAMFRSVMTPALVRSAARGSLP